jgi:acetyl esterase
MKKNYSPLINLYTGTTHEFFGMGAIVPQAKDAQMLAANKLKKAFGL